MPRTIPIAHRQKSLEVRLDDDGSLELYLDGCLRKRREPGARQPRYVWTNVELEWEEHHYVEARYWADDDRLQVSVNGKVLMDQQVGQG